MAKPFVAFQVVFWPVLHHPVERALTSEWLVNNLTMIVYENIFLVVLCTANLAEL